MQICRALKKYGYSNFSLTILEYCDKEKCIEREKYYINFFGTEYNTVKDPTLPPMSGRKHSDKSKTKISDAQKGNTSGFKKGEPKPKGSGSPAQGIEVIDKYNNDTTTSYNSISEAARALNINPGIISGYLINNQVKPYKGRYIFKKL
jgi:hypothetical protein